MPNFCKVWTLARLYNEDPAHKTPEILAAARAGAEFLRKHTYDAASQRVYFCVAEDGKVWCVGCGGCELSASVSPPPLGPKPIKLQRKLFAEAFYVMAMSELSRALADVLVELSGASCAVSSPAIQLFLLYITKTGTRPAARSTLKKPAASLR